MLEISNLGILSDDLTGACDVAASFAPFAGPVRVYIHPDAVSSTSAKPFVINTQSRLMSA